MHADLWEPPVADGAEVDEQSMWVGRCLRLLPQAIGITLPRWVTPETFIRDLCIALYASAMHRGLRPQRDREEDENEEDDPDLIEDEDGFWGEINREDLQQETPAFIGFSRRRLGRQPRLGR